MQARALNWVSRKAVLLMSLIAILITYLNYYAEGMSQMLIRYQDFKNVILAGFDTSVSILPYQTAPMWGYGWVMILTENHIALLILQFALSVTAVISFLKFLERRAIVTGRAMETLRVLLVFSLPWYTYHSLRWPYSFAVSLFFLSFIQLLEALDRQSFLRAAVSGILFGALLNFRSDYYLMPVGFAFISLMVLGWTRKRIALLATWVASILLLLVPWMVFTYQSLGVPLITSTNKGHVLFIGLGDLPNNKWGIIDEDRDPLMHEIVDDHFGPHAPTLNYAASQILEVEWKKRVLAEPLEYLKKLAYSTYLTMTRGTYSGEFYEKPACKPDCETLFREVRDSPFSRWTQAARERGLSPAAIYLKLVCNLIGRAVVFFSFLLLPFTAWRAYRERNLPVLLMVAALCYQSLISIVADHMVSYTSNLYFFHLINLVIAKRNLPKLGQFAIPRRT